MSPPKSYVRIDEHGVYRVANTHVMLESVIYPFREGDSPECICDQYSSLTLEDIHGCIAYYLGNREEVDAYLQRQEALWEELRRRSDENPSPVVQRLRAMLRAREGQAS